MPRGVRRKIRANLVGLYEDDIGRVAVARVPGARPREKRFPRRTAISVMQQWQDDTRRELRKRLTGVRAAAPAGSLAAEVHAYLATMTGTTLRDQKNLLAHWLEALPAGIAHNDVRQVHLRGAVRGWVAAGVAASTINHRRRALIKFFDATADDEDAVNPARRLPRATPPRAEPRAIAVADALGIIEAMPDRGRRAKGFAVVAREYSKTKARYRLMLWTGLDPASQKRIDPRTDVDLDAATVYVRPRRKGKGTEGVTLPLLPEGVAAFRAWLRAFAWGTWDTTAARRSFRLGVKAYQATREAEGHPVTLPRDLRPYDLRHTFLSWLLETTGDIFAVKEYARHTDIRSTLRYTQRAVSPRLQSAIETVALARGTNLKTGTNS